MSDFEDLRALLRQLCEDINYPFDWLIYCLATYLYFEWVFGNISNIEITYDGLANVVKTLRDTSSKDMTLPFTGPIFPPKMGEAHDKLDASLRKRFNSFNNACLNINHFLSQVQRPIKTVSIPEIGIIHGCDLSKIPLTLGNALRLMNLLDKSDEASVISDKYVPMFESILPKFRSSASVRNTNFPRQCIYCGRLYELTRISGTKIRWHCENEECKGEHKRLQKANQRAKKQDPNKWVKASKGTCNICNEQDVGLNSENLCKVCVEEAPKG